MYVYKEWKPRAESLALVEKCNEILDTDLAGYRVTLRQLYYQLVSRNIVPNTDRAYKNLGNLLTKARLAGLVPWNQIEDRGRQPQKHPEFDGLSDLTEAAIQSYRLPRWDDQIYYVELWVEKDALASVLLPIANDFHITLMVNKGYSSASAMKTSAERFIRRGDGKTCVLFYLGDLDPSGEDMVRDIDDRLYLFNAEVEVKKVALTMAQVEEYDPPPNPTKMTDTRAAKFIAQYGTSSWEVDALHPSVLREVIEAAIGPLVDFGKMDAIKEREVNDIERLRHAVSDLEDSDED